MPKVLNEHLDEITKDAVYIGRPTIFGNPYTHLAHSAPNVTVVDSREEAIDRFTTYFFERLASDEEFKERVDELKDKDLICFCAPLACHGDVILSYLKTLE